VEPILYRRPELEPPDGRDFFTSPQKRDARPLFSPREVGLVFFGRSKIWMFQNMREKNHIIWGVSEPIVKKNSGYQFLQLYHIEVMAHAFFSRDIIDLNTFENAIVIIKRIAMNYRLLDRRTNRWRGKPIS
jgi:hypothetical protein